MNRLKSHISILLLLAVVVPATALAQLEVPTLTTYLTDEAGVIDGGSRDKIEQLLQSYDQSTSNQFVVLVVNSLEGESIEDYSIRVAEKNKIGRSGDDNGLLFVVAVQDRKMRFEVGYGLEPVLTDAMTSTIIREVIAPEFRNGNFAQGIYSGMQAAIQAASGEFKASEAQSRDDEKSGVGGIVKVIVFLIILFFLFKGRRGRGSGIWFIGGPGGFGGGGGGFGGGGFSGFSGGGGSFGGGGSSGSW